MRNPKLKPVSKIIILGTSTHDKQTQSWTRLDRFSYTRIPNIDKQTHIHDVTKSQNNTHFITNNTFSIKTIAAHSKQK